MAEQKTSRVSRVKNASPRARKRGRTNQAIPVCAKVISAAAGVVGFARTGSAAPYYFDPNGTGNATGTYNWDNSTTSAWSSVAAGSTPTTYVQGSDAYFSAPTTGVNSTPTFVGAIVVGSQYADSLSFLNGTTTILGTSTPQLSVGAGGITNSATVGNTTLDTTLGTVLLTASQTWTGSASKNLLLNASITPNSNLGPIAFDLDPTGNSTYNASNFTFSAPITDAAAGSPLSVLKLGSGVTFFNGTNSYTGGTTIEGGFLFFGNASSPTPLGAIGNGTVVIDAGVLGLSQTTNYTSANYNGTSGATGGTSGFIIGPRAGILLMNAGGKFVNTSTGASTGPIDSTSSGFVAFTNGSSLPTGTAVNQSTFGNGTMFFTGIGTTGGGYTGISGGVETAGKSNIYRLGAGAGGITFNNSGLLTNTVVSSANTAVVIGEPLASVGGTLGIGTVILNNNTTTSGTTGTTATNTITQSYLGATTVNQGSRVDAFGLTSGIGSPFGSTSATINLNAGSLAVDQMTFKNTSGTTTTYYATGTISVGMLNFNGNSTATLAYLTPAASGTNTTNLTITNSPVSSRQGNGILQIATPSSSGAATNVLGSTSHVYFGGSPPTLVNGILPVYIQDSAGNFLTYDEVNSPSNGVIPDTSILVAFPTSGGAATGSGNVSAGATAIAATVSSQPSVNSLVLSGSLTTTTSNKTVTDTSGGLSFTGTTTIGSTTANQNVNLAFGNAEAVLSGNSTGTITNVISNSIGSTTSAGLTKGGTNTIDLLGANSFTGYVSIEGGTLNATSDNAFGVSGNNIFINAGTLGIITNSVATSRTITIGNGVGSVSTSTYTNDGGAINAGGHTLTLNGYLTTGASGTGASYVDFNNGTIVLGNVGANSTPLNDFTAPVFVEGGATLSISADNQLGAAVNTVTLNGSFSLSGTGPNVLVSNLASLQATGSTPSTSHAIILNGSGGEIDTPSGTTFTVNSVISGGAPLTKTSTGTLIFAGANTYSGLTNISAGTLQIGAGTASGQLAGTSVANAGALVFDLSSSPTVANAISGAGSLTQEGSGILTLTASNTYAGSTTLAAGELDVDVADAPGTAGPLGKSGTIFLTGGYLQYSSLNQNDYSARFSTAANQQYNVDTNGTTVTFASALNSSGGSLTKIGAGELILSANDAYNNPTTISAGTLLLASAGSIGTSSLIDVRSGAAFDVSAVSGHNIGPAQTLQGNGTVYGSTTLNGTLLPGEGDNSEGKITVSGNLTLGATANTHADIAGLSPGVTGGYDQVAVGGSLAYGSGSLTVNLIGPAATGDYVLFSVTGGSAAISGDFTNIQVNGSSGYDSVALGETSAGIWQGTSPSGNAYTFTDSSGDFNVVAAPEPASATVLALGGMMMLRRRRVRAK